MYIFYPFPDIKSLSIFECNCNYNYILFTKLLWTGDSEGDPSIFQLYCYLPTCLTHGEGLSNQYIHLISERQAGKL